MLKQSSLGGNVHWTFPFAAELRVDPPPTISKPIGRRALPSLIWHSRLLQGFRVGANTTWGRGGSLACPGGGLLSGGLGGARKFALANFLAFWVEGGPNVV